ncbi:MAG: ribonuclease E/G [Butyrivibrio sp.]|nr:ribonuclease E/G [Butyrivibrio sp.]
MTDIFVSKYEEYPVVSAYIDNKLEFLSVVRDSVLNDVYLCRVENILKNINSAFVRYGDDQHGYVALKNVLGITVVNRQIGSSGELRQGDEIVLQVEAEPLKLKKAKLSSRISVSGRFCAVTLGRKGVGASLKLSEEKRTRLIDAGKKCYAELTQKFRSALYDTDFGVIIRTDADSLPDDELFDSIRDDMEACLNKICDILETAKSRKVFSCLLKNDSADEEFHISKAKAFIKTKTEDEPRILRESVVYSIKKDIEKLLLNRVWLKSGAFLVIEQLESFNAIDVNTGKAISGKGDVIFKVNMEAADEIFRQIRLRNLTGMILIDFINMKGKSDVQKLCDHVRSLARKEVVHTEFVDITGLGVIELTRNKNDKSLKEILQKHNQTVDNIENG